MPNYISMLKQHMENLKAEVPRLQQAENEEVYRSLFEHNHSVMLLIDPETAEIRDANPAACAYYGWSREQLKNARMDEINTLPRDEIFAQMQLARTEKRRNFFFKHRRADGSVRDVEVYSGPLTVKGQALLYSIIHDITERKQFADALRESEDKYNQIVESLADAVLVWFDEEIIYANPAALKLFKVKQPADLIGKRYLDLVHPDDRPESSGRITKSKNERWIAPRREHRILAAGGQPVYVESTGVPIQVKGQILHLGIFSDISKRKRAEEELRENEERMRIANEAARIGTYTADLEADEVYWSPELCDIVGVPYRTKLSHKEAYNIVHKDDLASVLDINRQSKDPEGEGCFASEHRIVRPDGQVRWVLWRGRTIFREADSGKVPSKRIGACVDITERKHAEEALRESDSRFRVLVESAPDAIFVQSAGRFSYLNPAACRLFGALRSEDLLGKDCVERIAPEFRDRIWEPARIQREHGENAALMEQEYLRLDGSRIHVETTAIPIRFKGEQSHLVFIRDITARKLTDAKLRETEKKYRELAESLPQVIFEIDSLGNLIYLNKIGHGVLGYTPEELANGFNVLEAIIPEDKERVARDILSNAQGRRLGQQEYTAVKKDGTRFPIAVHANRIMRGRTAVGVRGILIDLTSMKRAEEEKKKLQIQLQQAQKMEAIGSLAGGIAHDFNNILSVIIGNAEILRMTDMSFSGKDEVDQILVASKRARDLVRQILAFSRQGEQKKILMSLKPVVKETIEFLRASIPSTIQLQHSIRPDAGAVMADPTQMQQVLMNLSTNAAHAMEKEGGVLRIELDHIQLFEKSEMMDWEAEPGHYLRITVSDTGNGIAPEMLPRIFDPYFTTKGPDRGTGLGLSVVHGIVRSHGGVVKVCSEVGKGTAFHVFLPRSDGAVKKEEKAEQKLPIGTERILVVDDEMHLLEMYQRMLGLLGYQVDTRTSPIEALEALRSNPTKYDLVLTDMTMPQMNGHKLTKKIMEIRPGLPVILCTGFSDQIDEEKARSVGILAFLLKPVLFHDLASSLRKALDDSSKKR